MTKRRVIYHQRIAEIIQLDEEVKSKLEAFRDNSLARKGFHLEKLYKKGSLSLYSLRTQIEDRIILTKVKNYWIALGVLYKHDYNQINSNRNDWLNTIQLDIAALNLDQLEEAYLEGEEDDLDDSSSVNAEYLTPYIQFTGKDYIIFAETQRLARDACFPLLTSGSPGSGKTSIALAKLAEAVIKNKNGKYLYIAESEELISDVKIRLAALLGDLGFPEGIALVEFVTPKEAYIKKYGEPKAWANLTTLDSWLKKTNQSGFSIKTEDVYNEFLSFSGYQDYDEYAKQESQRHSFVNAAQKLTLWNLYQEYQSYLRETNQPDLSFYELSLTPNDYDVVAVDEGYDLSQRQLASAFFLAKGFSTIICLGNQQKTKTARPVVPFLKYFMYKLGVKNVDAHHIELDINYRSAQLITIATNGLLQILHYLVGSLALDKNESRYLNVDNEAPQGMVRWWTKPEELLALEEDKKSAEFIVIAPTHFWNEAVKLYGKHRVFSPRQIKGLECQHVLTYGLFSDEKYKALLKKITFILEIQIKPEQFIIPKEGLLTPEEILLLNDLKIAFTRAQSILTVYEPSAEYYLNPIHQMLKDFFEKITANKEFKPEALKLKESSAEEWQQQRDRLLKQGLEEQAAAIPLAEMLRASSTKVVFPKITQKNKKSSKEPIASSSGVGLQKSKPQTPEVLSAKDKQNLTFEKNYNYLIRRELTNENLAFIFTENFLKWIIIANKHDLLLKALDTYITKRIVNASNWKPSENELKILKNTEEGRRVLGLWIFYKLATSQIVTVNKKLFKFFQELIKTHHADLTVTNTDNMSLLHLSVGLIEPKMIAMPEYMEFLKFIIKINLSRKELVVDKVGQKEEINTNWINWRDKNGNTPLHIAISRRRFAAAVELCKNDAKIDVQNNVGHAPIHLILSGEIDNKFLQYFLEQKPKLHFIDTTKSYPLRYALESSTISFENLKIIINESKAQQVDFELKNKDGLSVFGFLVIAFIIGPSTSHDLLKKKFELLVYAGANIDNPIILQKQFIVIIKSKAPELHKLGELQVDDTLLIRPSALGNLLNSMSVQLSTNMPQQSVQTNYLSHSNYLKLTHGVLTVEDIYKIFSSNSITWFIAMEKHDLLSKAIQVYMKSNLKISLLWSPTEEQLLILKNTAEGRRTLGLWVLCEIKYNYKNKLKLENYNYIQKLIDVYDADLLVMDEENNTILHYAVTDLTFCALELVAFLINKNKTLMAQINVRNETALHIAIKVDNYEACVKLCESGVNLNAQGAGGGTPLHYSLSPPKIKIIRYLLNLKVNLLLLDEINAPAFFYITRNMEIPLDIFETIVKKSKEQGIDFNTMRFSAFIGDFVCMAYKSGIPNAQWLFDRLQVLARAGTNFNQIVSFEREWALSIEAKSPGFFKTECKSNYIFAASIKSIIALMLNDKLMDLLDQTTSINPTVSLSETPQIFFAKSVNQASSSKGDILVQDCDEEGQTFTPS